MIKRMLCLMLLCLMALPVQAMPREQYMRAIALVNWTKIVPQIKLEEETMPTSYEARITKSGKLQSLGLNVRIGDLIRVDQQGPYIWTLTKGDSSIKINTYDIPAEAYPRFRE